MAVPVNNRSIDIGVCTFRRPELADTLRSLAAMDMPPGFDVSVIIADNDDADVAALHGWRRELFGEKALALKHGKLALTVEKGKVMTIARS